MKISRQLPLFAALAAESSTIGLGKAGAAEGTANQPQASAEPVKKATKQDPLEAALSPEARKVLKQRKLNKEAAAPAITPPADDKAAKAAAAASAAPPAFDKPADGAKPGDEGKTDDEPELSGVIDFSKPSKDAKAGNDDAPPEALTEAELADLKIVQGKLTEAHKDSAAQRKLKREALEAKEKLEQENQKLKADMEALRKEAQTIQPAGGRYLDQFQTAAEVNRAREDALEALRQLADDPEIEEVLLPGNRKWSMLDDKGKSIAAEAKATAFEIIEDHGTRLERIAARQTAEKVAAEKLPLISKALPEIEKSYKEILASDWASNAPRISLEASLGKLVLAGKYVMTPAGKQAAPKAAPVEPKKPASELPNNTPPARPAEAGVEDLSHLRVKAMKGETPQIRKKALEEWIKRSGKKAA